MSMVHPPRSRSSKRCPHTAECQCEGFPRLFCDTIEQLRELHSRADTDSPDSASANIPSRARVVDALHCLQNALFPGRMSTELTADAPLEPFVEEQLSRACLLLTTETARSLPFRWIGAWARSQGVERDVADAMSEATNIVGELIRRLPEVRRKLVLDVEAAYQGDPAATTYAEIMLSYPCIGAIITHRIAHELYLMRVPLVPRMMSEHAHSHTGIDIHPGATIGESFFVDHGTGVVIGETTVIGHSVKLYQGVTLGARSFPLDEHGNPIKGIKRHPTLEDNVIVYPNASILGGETVIGHDAVVGANVWIDKSVPPYSLVIPKNVEMEIRNA